MRTRFVFFDLGNVLLRFQTENLLARTAEVMECDADRIHRALFGSGLQKDVECGRLSEEEFFKEFCRQLDRTPDRNRLAEAMNNIFTVLDEMQPFVDRVVAADMPRGILSNTGVTHWNYCVKKFPFLLQSFPGNHVLSFEVGAMKPGPAIFQAALETARKTVSDIEKKEILFIDDLESNVQGAGDFGLDAIVFSSAEMLADAFQHRKL